MATQQLFASAVEIDITPPVGIPLEGYAAREGVSRGVHDPLLAQLLLFKIDEEQVVLIALDLLGVRLDFTKKVRTGIQEAIGVPRASIMLACSHTHSGPAGFLPDLPGLRTYPDLEFQRVVERKLIGAAIEAGYKLAPARLGAAYGWVQGVGTNRNDPEAGPFDDQVVVLRVDDMDGKPIAVLMNFGCHPTVMGHENLFLTADFPGAARAALGNFYPDTIFMFTNGAAGDVSTRFMRREQSFAEAERLGQVLGGEVLKVMETTITRNQIDLAGWIDDIDLKLKEFPPEEETNKLISRLEAELESLKASGASQGFIRRAFTRLQGARGQAENAKRLRGKDHINTQLQLITIGDLALIGLPGEVFTRISLEIKKKSGYSNTAVISYCNDEVGYFPDVESFTIGTYEALISPYQDNIAETLTKRCLAMLGRGLNV